ncbi:MAG: CIA30 family protein [Planctomycetes bacterium]|nr:CIA30 family protein [Planctomycetota bacterium]MBL7145029.1 CIA30 family protein [Phycisphaerae bacterium]
MKLINSNSGSMLLIWILSFGSLSIGLASEPMSKPLIDFYNASIARQWISVNDNVMGGISDGSFRFTDDKTLEFSGNLSLENRGGFASIRTRPADLKLDGYDTIAIRVKGDGRTYYFNLRTSSRNAAGSYRAPVNTQKETWQEVRIPLKNFEYTSYGRRIAGAEPLRANKVQSVGFTLSDKKAGPFRLEVSWIRAEKAAPAQETPAENKDIVDTAVAAGKFKTLLAAVKAAGLVEALKGEGPLTVFAPNDDAFAKLPKGSVEKLLKPENREELIAILSYHVLPGKILLSAQSLETLQGQSVTIRTAGAFEVNGVNVIVSDIAASNGVIHVIDSVLIPPLSKLTPQEAARAVIELAISRGVPLFNSGQPSACAAIYEVAAESLLKSHTNALGDKNRSALRNALKKIRGDEEDASQQAWTLRRALDVVYESLPED